MFANKILDNHRIPDATLSVAHDNLIMRSYGSSRNTPNVLYRSSPNLWVCYPKKNQNAALQNQTDVQTHSSSPTRCKQTPGSNQAFLQLESGLHAPPKTGLDKKTKQKPVHWPACVVKCRFQVMRWNTRKRRTQLPLIYALKSVTHSRNLSLSVARLNWLSRRWSRRSKTSYQERRLKDF